MAEQSAQMLNIMARNRVVKEAIPTFVDGGEESLIINAGDLASVDKQTQPPTLGFQLGFMITVEATFTNSTGGVLTLTPFGAANLLQNVTYYDPQNTMRTNVSGRMLDFWMAQKQGTPYGDTLTPDEGYGTRYNGDWRANYAPTTIASGATTTIRKIFYLPLAMSEYDLRGAVWGNLQQAYQRLNFKFANVAKFVASSTESPLEAVYQSASASKALTFSNVKYRTKMHTYAQNLPTNADGAYVAPLMDLGTVYGFNETTATGLTVNQRKSVAYPNAWQYLATHVIFANGTQLNAGTDVTELEINTASGVSFGKFTPFEHVSTTINRLGVAPPLGMYYDSHHKNPIRTSDYGTVSWGVTPSLVNANAYLQIGYEYMDNLATYQATGLSMDF